MKPSRILLWIFELLIVTSCLRLGINGFVTEPCNIKLKRYGICVLWSATDRDSGKNRNTPSRQLHSCTSLINENKGDLIQDEEDLPISKEDSVGPRLGLGYSLEHSPCLVLNANFQPVSYLPLSLWNWQDSVRAVLANKVTILSEYDNLFIRSTSFTMHLPSVVVLKKYFQFQDSIPAVTQRFVFLRDDYQCQYCGKLYLPEHLTVDHVIPRKLGGKTTWNNVVTACYPCNQKKGCYSVKELSMVGMRLRKMPHVPTMFELQKKYRQRQRVPEDPLTSNDDAINDDGEAKESNKLFLSADIRKKGYHPHWLQYL